MGSQALAIVWAQWRSMTNRYKGSRSSRVPFTFIAAMIWYGLWAFIALFLAQFCADPGKLQELKISGARSLLLILAYWQLTPILSVNSGASLDLSRLRVYPIPVQHLFSFEVLLRITTCVEMILVTAGAAVGLTLNPALPAWAALPLLPFAAMNLFLSSAVRDLLVRLFARKGIREAMVFLLVLLTALPQLVLQLDLGHRFELGGVAWAWTPWGATALLVTGDASLMPLLSILSWTLAAWFGAKLQFERSLRFDQDEVRSMPVGQPGRKPLVNRALRLPSLLFTDPLAALIEKEVRVLARSPRFRLLFMMGFSFGILIWLPIALRGGSGLRANYLTVVSGYSLMLLGEVCFWNNLGMDRAAVQAYFVMPVNFGTVLIAKNLAAAAFISMELVMVTIVCAVLRMPLTFGSIVETWAVTAVLVLLLFAIGNLLSVRHPRPVDPSQSWRTGGVGQVQAYLLFIYPVVSAPVLLAYGARYAFNTEWAFYGVLLIDFVLGSALYSISLESAVGEAEARREPLILSMAKSEAPAA